MAAEEEDFDRPEYGWWTRAGPISSIVENLKSAGGGGKQSMIRDPTNRFYLYVDAIARKFIETGVVTFRVSDIDYMLKYIDKLNEPRYKNPTAFVLAYDIVASRDESKQNIDKTFARFIDKTEDVDRSGVTLVDLIRYVFLWDDLKKK